MKVEVTVNFGEETLEAVKMLTHSIVMHSAVASGSMTTASKNTGDRVDVTWIAKNKSGDDDAEIANEVSQADVEAEIEAEAKEEPKPKKKAAKKKAPPAPVVEADDEDESEAEDDAEDSDDFMQAAPAKKAAKVKAVTVDDVNDACKARAGKTGGKEGRAEVLALLKKYFKVASISEIDSKQYQEVINIMTNK